MSCGAMIISKNSIPLHLNMSMTLYQMMNLGLISIKPKENNRLFRWWKWIKLDKSCSYTKSFIENEWVSSKSWHWGTVVLEGNRSMNVYWCKLLCLLEIIAELRKVNLQSCIFIMITHTRSLYCIYSVI